MKATRLPVTHLVRHCETAWSLSGQHTGLTDLPLTRHGEQVARWIGECLRGIDVERVFTSPLKRAVRTCELAGFGSVASVEPGLVEWDYGQYEGLTTEEIHARNPNWSLFRDGCPGGETPAQVVTRADGFIEKLRSGSESVLIFSSGHILRVITARWLGLGPEAAEFFLLSAGGLSALGYEMSLSNPVVQFWNNAIYKG